MGQLVRVEVAAAPDLEFAWTCGRTLPDDLAADVIIDFSTPDALRRLLSVAPCPVVTGTTGLVLPDAPTLALLHAANFSLGVAVLARLVRTAAVSLPGYDIEVVELHHRGKRDAPSGTALRLVDGLGRVVSGRSGPRVEGEIGIHAVRGGEIVGEHRVFLCGHGERLELAHIATDRGVFAAGAVRAARWIQGRPPGRYTVEDVIAAPRSPQTAPSTRPPSDDST